jgi:hypothetical protein
MIATNHDVVDRAGIFDAQRAGHGPTLTDSRVGVNSKEQPLYAPLSELGQGNRSHSVSGGSYVCLLDRKNRNATANPITASNTMSNDFTGGEDAGVDPTLAGSTVVVACGVTGCSGDN